MKKFDQNEADIYDGSIVNKVPGYRDFMGALARHFSTTLPMGAEVLVVGAGTGAEIFALGSLRPDLHFFAVDTSTEMLGMLERKNQQRNLPLNIQYSAHAIQDLKLDHQFDAAFCLLVMHFFEIPVKTAMLKAIQSLVKPGGQLLTYDYMNFLDAELEQEQGLFLKWCREWGLSESQKDLLLTGLQERFRPATPEQMRALFKDNGAERVTDFFVRPRFRGFLTEF